MGGRWLLVSGMAWKGIMEFWPLLCSPLLPGHQERSSPCHISPAMICDATMSSRIMGQLSRDAASDTEPKQTFPPLMRDSVKYFVAVTENVHSYLSHPGRRQTVWPAQASIWMAEASACGGEKGVWTPWIRHQLSPVPPLLFSPTHRQRMFLQQF